MLTAQVYINRSKDFVKQHLQNQQSLNDSMNVRLSETDSSIIYFVKSRKPLGGQAIFVYSFDSKGKCNAEETFGFCDACFQKYLDKALSRKEFKWVQLNDRTYVSSFAKKVMIEIPAQKDSYNFIIQRMNWTRESYRSLLNHRTN